MRCSLAVVALIAGTWVKSAGGSYSTYTTGGGAYTAGGGSYTAGGGGGASTAGGGAYTAGGGAYTAGGGGAASTAGGAASTAGGASGQAECNKLASGLPFSCPLPSKLKGTFTACPAAGCTIATCCDYPKLDAPKTKAAPKLAGAGAVAVGVPTTTPVATVTPQQFSSTITPYDSSAASGSGSGNSLDSSAGDSLRSGSLDSTQTSGSDTSGSFGSGLPMWLWTILGLCALCWCLAGCLGGLMHHGKKKARASTGLQGSYDYSPVSAGSLPPIVNQPIMVWDQPAQGTFQTMPPQMGQAMQPMQAGMQPMTMMPQVSSYSPGTFQGEAMQPMQPGMQAMTMMPQVSSYSPGTFQGMPGAPGALAYQA